MEKRGRGGELFQLDEVGAERMSSFTAALLPRPPWTSSSPTSTTTRPKQEPDQAFVLVEGATIEDDVQEDEETEAALDMPPGFRFKPTDPEVIYYLEEKCADWKFRARAITEIDINNCEPWDLPDRAKMGEKEWYFFWEREHKYPTGSRTNRATAAGYWKATGKDKEIFRRADKGGAGNSKGPNPVRYLVGMKKTLVFYLGRAPKGTKTNWVMHEYRRIPHGHSQHAAVTPANGKKDWVVCRVFHKTTPEASSSTAPPSSDASEQSPRVSYPQHQTYLSPTPTAHNYNPNYAYPSSSASDMLLVSPTLPPLLDYPSNPTPFTTATTTSVLVPPAALYDYGSTGLAPSRPHPYIFPTVEDVGVRSMISPTFSTGSSMAQTASALLRGKCKAELDEYMTALRAASTAPTAYNQLVLPLQESGYDDDGGGASSPCSSSDAPLAGLDTMWDDFNAAGSADG